MEPFLRPWEVKTELDRGRREAAFEFVDSETIDRDPPPPPAPGEPRVVELAAEVTAYAVVGADMSFEVRRTSYPDPPLDFAFDPLTETLWNRFEGYRGGRRRQGEPESAAHQLGSSSLGWPSVFEAMTDTSVAGDPLSRRERLFWGC